MSEGRWTPDVWERGEAAARRLPRVEDLPLAEQGFDREAVREAFDSFYRHAAELDATLRLLESVEVFGAQARELRAEIRSLRAASWGPLPQRHVWSAARGSSMPTRTGGAVPSALPRLAVEGAFIVLVAVGAALADLSVALIVLLVLAAWLIVGVAEFASSTRRATPRPGLLPAPARREEAPVSAQAPPPPPPAEAAGQETMIEPAPIAEPAVQPEPEPSRAAPPEPDAERPATVLQAEPTTKRRWFRKKPAAEPELAPVAQSKHVRVLPVEPAPEEPAPVADPWEQGPDLHPGEIDVSQAPTPPDKPEPEAGDESDADQARVEPAAARDIEPERDVPAEAEAEQAPPSSWPFAESGRAEILEPEPEADEPELQPSEEPEELSAPPVSGAASDDEPVVFDEPQAHPTIEPEPEPDAALADAGPEPPEAEGGRRFWQRRQREPEAQPTPEPIPEASPFESEPPAERTVHEAEAETAEEEEQSPLPEVAPFQPETEEARLEESPPAAALAAPRRRRRLWRRARGEEATPQEPSPPAPHVERIEVEQAIDPRRAAALWGESAFAAEPKPGDTWIQPFQAAGAETEEGAETEIEPTQEADEAEAKPERQEVEAPPIAGVVHVRSRSQVSLRRGRR